MLYYYSEKQAEKEFEATLVSWAKDYGYKGCYSQQETHKKLIATVKWAQRSPLARQIFEFVSLHSKRIVVVGMKGGFQCFSSTEGDNKVPVVYIDLDGKLTINARTPHNLHFDPSARLNSGLRADTSLHIDPSAWGNRPTAELDNNIALLHELGHAKQWLERPQLFDGDYRAGGLDFTLALRKHAETVVKRGLEKAPDSPLAHNIRMAAGRTLADFPSVPQTPEELAQVKKNRPVWSVHIESDNMARHEWPICRELGLPYRQNYRDINVTSDGAPSTTSQIRRKVEQEAKAQREKAEEEAKRKGQVKVMKTGALVECPRCHRKVKPMFLNSPCGTPVH
jgi:hypothetical protein